MINEETVEMFMNTFTVSTAPKCPQCGDSSPRDITRSELGAMKCLVCGTSIPKQVSLDAVFAKAEMHLLGDVNVASGLEAIRRAGV
jgi:translation initiation factor 2 beta subunit (eIF-2beta)/eIF-5